MNIVETIIEKSAHLFKKYELAKVYLFKGSMRRGVQNNFQDVDILIETKVVPFGLAEFKREMEEALGCKVNILKKGDVSSYVRDFIAKELIPVYENKR